MTVAALSLTPAGYQDIGLEHWLLAESGAFDPIGRAIADGHYSRRTPGAPQFMPPGQRFALVSKNARSVWGWWRPNMNGSHVARNGLDGWTCTIFRRPPKSPGPSASELVLDAERAIAATGRDCGPDGLLTYVWDAKVKSENPGYCFKVAGWHTAGGRGCCAHMRPRSADGKKSLLHKPHALAGVRPDRPPKSSMTTGEP
jgi:hypothetical protein